MSNYVQRQEEQQLQRELTLSSSVKKCNLRSVYTDVDQIKAELLKTELDGRFHSAQLMTVLFCMFDTLLYSPMSTSDGGRVGSDEVNKVFQEMRRIGAESVSGFALLSSFKDIENMFVVKVPRNPLNDDLYHEYFVAIACTNNLRQTIPNFAYVLGAFKCLPPVFSNDQRILEFCGKGNETNYVNYVIYEKVEGEDMAKRAQDCSFMDFLSWFIQIILATHIANEACDFTHYDLHSENVIMRPWRGNDGVGPPLNTFWIPYSLSDGSTIYVKSNRIATQIDFGRAHIRVGGDDFGYFGTEKYGVFPDAGRPWYDVYKFLGFSMYDMLTKGNMTCLDSSLLLYKIINTNLKNAPKAQIYQEIRNEINDYFVFDPEMTEFEQNSTLLDYLDAIAEAYPREWAALISETEPRGQILECERMVCPTTQRFEVELSSGAGAGISAENNLVEAMNLVESRSRSLQAEIANQTLHEIADGYRVDLSKMLNDINATMQELVDANPLTIGNTLSYDDINFTLQEFVEPHMQLKERVADYMSKLDVLRKYEETYGHNSDLVAFELGRDFEKWRRQYKQVYDTIGNAYFASDQRNIKNELLQMMYY